MDPKMDSGCLAPGESLDEDYDVTRALLPSEVVAIIDQLLCLEVSEAVPQLVNKLVLTTVADGMAPRVSTVPDAVHQRLH
jgi:hypothetical protein